MRLDLHTHSHYSSDSRLDPRDIIRRARQLGLDGIAITDHNSTESSRKTIDFGRDIKGFVIVRGVEVSSSEGHVLGYGVSEDIPRDLSPEETVRRIVEQGGVAVAAHPYRFWSGLGEKATLGTNFDVYEVRNARTSRRGNERADSLARSGGKSRVGGSDGHFIDEIGRAFTVLDSHYDREDDVLQAIAKRISGVGGLHRGIRATLRYVPKSVGEWTIRGFRRI